MSYINTAINLTKIGKLIAVLDILEKIKLVFEKYPEMYFSQTECYDSYHNYTDKIFSFNSNDEIESFECRNWQYDSGIQDIFKLVFDSLHTFEILFGDISFYKDLDIDECKKLIDENIKEINKLQDALNIRESFIE